MRKILVPMDGSKISLEAADEAVELAKKLGSEVTFLSVVENRLPKYDTTTAPENFIKKLDKRQQETSMEFEKMLNGLVRKYENTGVIMNQRVLFGVADQKIEEIANNESFDLIITGRKDISSVNVSWSPGRLKKALNPHFALY